MRRETKSTRCKGPNKAKPLLAKFLSFNRDEKLSMTFGNEEQIAENLGRIKNPTLWTKATSFIVYLPESRFWSVIGLDVECRVQST